MSEVKATVIGIEGIVAARNAEPYLILLINGNRVAQMSMADARNVARDIERMCSRTEADAMIFRFFGPGSDLDVPPAAMNALMLGFREFRSRLDAEEVVQTEHTPSGDDQGGGGA